MAWARREAAGALAGGVCESDDDFASLAGAIREDDRVTAVLPGEEVAMRLLPAPPRSAAKLRAAAQLLLEDELGEAVSDLHIVTAARDQVAEIYAIRERTIDARIAEVEAKGLRADQMIADYQALPAGADTAALFFARDRIVWRVGRRGAACENDLATLVLPRMLEASDPSDIDCYGEYSAGAQALGMEPEALQPLGAEGPAVFFARRLSAKEPVVDLLKGKAKRRARFRADAGSWRRPAIIFAAAAASWALVFIAGAVRDQRVAGAFEARAAELHATAFPGAAGADPRAHARSVLSTNVSAGFLDLSAVVAEAVDAATGLNIDRMRYDGARGRLVLSLRAQDDGEIETLRRALIDRGLAAQDAGGYRRTGPEWTGDMVVSGL